MSADAFLRQWTQVVQDLATLVDAALDVEPVGGCPAGWAERLARYEVMPVAEDARVDEVKRFGQTRGALLDEVEACLAGLSRDARARLEPLRRTLSPEQAKLVDESLRTLTDRAWADYRARATEKKKKMFGAAKALAKQHQYADAWAVGGYVLTCSACRAPRLGDSLACAFCGGKLEAMT